MITEVFERDAGADGNFAGHRIDRPERLKAADREDDISVARDASTNQACVPTLGDEGGPRIGASTHGGRNFVCVGGPDDETRDAVKAASPVGLVASAVFGVGEDVRGADDGGAALAKGIGHGLSVAVEVPGTQCPVPCVSYGDSP